MAASNRHLHLSFAASVIRMTPHASHPATHPLILSEFEWQPSGLGQTLPFGTDTISCGKETALRSFNTDIRPQGFSPFNSDERALLIPLALDYKQRRSPRSLARWPDSDIYATIFGARTERDDVTPPLEELSDRTLAIPPMHPLDLLTLRSKTVDESLIQILFGIIRKMLCLEQSYLDSSRKTLVSENGRRGVPTAVVSSASEWSAVRSGP